MKTAKLNFEAREALTPFGCGQCLPCRINRSRVWQSRLLLETMTAPFSSFVTLTYSEERIPPGGALRKKDVQNFLKRLRKALEPRRIRYFIVGEYGSRTQRPHYHAILFNVNYLESEVINKSWGNGFTGVGDVTPASVAYVCKYVVKNLKSGNPDLGSRPGEFMLCSKMDGGIGKAAVLEMADRLEKSGQASAVKDLSILKFGKRSRPIGRYLTSIFEGRFPHAQEARLNRYLDYQLSNLVHLESGDLYRDSLVAVDKNRADRLEGLNKFFLKKESI